jgi:hypothetical protein
MQLRRYLGHFRLPVDATSTNRTGRQTGYPRSPAASLGSSCQGIRNRCRRRHWVRTAATHQPSAVTTSFAMCISSALVPSQHPHSPRWSQVAVAPSGASCSPSSPRSASNSAMRRWWPQVCGRARSGPRIEFRGRRQRRHPPARGLEDARRPRRRITTMVADCSSLRSNRVPGKPRMSEPADSFRKEVWAPRFDIAGGVRVRASC